MTMRTYQGLAGLCHQPMGQRYRLSPVSLTQGSLAHTESKEWVVLISPAQRPTLAPTLG